MSLNMYLLNTLNFSSRFFLELSHFFPPTDLFQLCGNMFSGTGDLIALQDFQYIPDDIPRSDLNHYAVDNWLKIWGSGGKVKYTGMSDVYDC